MVLADLCQRAGIDFALAHCNFRLRGTESDADEALVRKRAKDLEKIFYVTHFDTLGYVNKNKVSVQMAARDLRYAWFAEIMHKNSLPILITAHHADDNLETFLINLSRGSGISGLIGIPEKTEDIARPLLPFSRERIMKYALENGLEWREDASNTDIKYLRNAVRKNVLPPLKDLAPNFLQHFQRSQSYLAQINEIAADRIRQVKEALFIQEDVSSVQESASLVQEDSGFIRKDTSYVREDALFAKSEVPKIRKKGRTKIPVRQLSELRPLKGYLYGLFKEYGFTEWDDVAHLLEAQSGKEVRSKSHRLIRHREVLVLTEISEVNKERFLIMEETKRINDPFKMEITTVDSLSETGPHILYASKKALKYPLTLRKREKGDYFYPLGMSGKKKLSKYFKDEKLDAVAREEQWLLCSEGAIVWVVGRRADERFKVTKNTREIIRFQLK